MIKFGVLLLIGCGLTAALPPQLDGRIVGGEDADIKDFPHQVSFRWYNSHICGGSIIGNKWILTAAHCTRGRRAEDISFQAGSTNRRTGGAIYQAKRIMDHPDYNPSNYDFDYSLIEVTSPISFTDKIQPIALARTEPPKGRKTIVTGWGALSSGGPSPDILQKVTVNVIDRRDCTTQYGPSKITDRMVCAADMNKDSCQGDSGGPLIDPSGKQLVGVVSWGYGCADPNYPGVYSNVARVRDWIYDVTGNIF